MNVPWKLKSNIFGLIDFFNVPSVLYFLQKNITRRSRVSSKIIYENWRNHKKYLEKYRTTKFVFEFGAGKTLGQNLFLSDIVNQQVVVDLHPMLDLELAENARQQIAKSVTLRSETGITTLSSLAEYGIKYRAPYDAAETGFADQSVDACISTNTLEHIPEESINRIFSELHRTLKDDGIVSARIDYSDHYSHTDRNIYKLNYLKFDENSWKKFNHACHYQNRLRHYEYIEIFNRCGFVVIEEELDYEEENNIPADIIEKFRGKKDETWKATGAHIILKKAGRSAFASS